MDTLCGSGYHDYADIGIAVSSPKGLMVPVVRNAERMSLAEIEREIKRLAIKARDGKITPDEIPAIIESCERRRAGKTLPAHGLFLEWVSFEDQ